MRAFAMILGVPGAAPGPSHDGDVIALPIVLLVVFGYAANFNVIDPNERLRRPGRCGGFAAAVTVPTQTVDPSGDHRRRGRPSDNEADVAIIADWSLGRWRTWTVRAVRGTDGQSVRSQQPTPRSMGTPDTSGSAPKTSGIEVEVLYNPDLRPHG
ncbi:MAG: hypothetical protein R2714_17230 [Microthrixaceae bacterium]